MTQNIEPSLRSRRFQNSRRGHYHYSKTDIPNGRSERHLLSKFKNIFFQHFHFLLIFFNKVSIFSKSKPYSWLLMIWNLSIQHLGRARRWKAVMQSGSRGGIKQAYWPSHNHVIAYCPTTNITFKTFLKRCLHSQS